MYEENSCIYIFTRENLIAKRHRISDHPLMFEIPRLEAVDIDEESDFQIANILMRLRSTQTNGN
jgi:CMP-N-acetylneuraminic acid synthetase